MTLVYVLANDYQDFEWLRAEVKAYTNPRKGRLPNGSALAVAVAPELVKMGFRKRDLRYLDRRALDKLKPGFFLVVITRNKFKLVSGEKQLVENVKPRLLELCRQKGAAMLNL